MKYLHGVPEWTVVRSYDEFVQKINEVGLESIELISLDHDLGDTAMAEWHRNVYHNYELNYDNITEKTGMDCTKWLVNEWMFESSSGDGFYKVRQNGLKLTCTCPGSWRAADRRCKHIKQVENELRNI